MLTPFYRRAEYRDVAGGTTRPPAPPPRVRLHGGADLRLNLLLSRFKATFPSYAGVLQGEYVAMENGHTLIDHDGELIVINCSADDFCAAKDLNEAAYQLDFQQGVVDTYRQWYSLPVAEHTAILSHTFPDNYHHFCMDLLPQLRLLSLLGAESLALPRICLQSPAQRDLVSRAQGGCKVALMDAPFRVRDPILLHSFDSTFHLSWLRQTVGLQPVPGNRRLYIRRNNLSRPGSGGGIAATESFRELLDEFGFESIDFGAGELTVAQQLSLVEGAGLIVSAHGASLTNTAFLRPPLTVVELFGGRVAAVFMDIAGQLGFAYHGVLCSKVDTRGDILADCDQLRDIFTEALSAPESQAA